MDTEQNKEEIIVSNKISYDEFKKVEIKAGKILSAEQIEGSDKLLKLSVDFGLKPSVNTEGSPEHSATQNVLGEERDIRQIVSGIRGYFPNEQELVGVVCMFVTNLEPRKLMGLESNGMLFAVGGKEGNPFSLLKPHQDTILGTQAS